MNLIWITYWIGAFSFASGFDGYERIEITPNGYPHLGLQKGSRNDVIPSAMERIVDGQFASAKQLPYHVGLLIGFENDWYSWCGGTLIGNEWIITAAHCTSGGRTFEVHLGCINSKIPFRVSWGYQNHIHPNFDNYRNDIALVKIKWVDYNVNMGPAVLPPLNGEHSLYVNARVVASGWGAANDKGQRVNHLKYVVMTVMKPEDCANVFVLVGKNPGVLCTNTKGFGSTCLGDSGGPLVLNNTQLLIGVTSFGSKRGCMLGVPNGFARVTYYLNWINKISGIYY